VNASDRVVLLCARQVQHSHALPHHGGAYLSASQTQTGHCCDAGSCRWPTLVVQNSIGHG
jgi:hypothetical protein